MEITERKRAEAELRDLNERLEQRVEERTRSLREEVAERQRVEDLLRIQRDLAVSLSSTQDLLEASRLVIDVACRIDPIDCGGVYVVDVESGTMDLITHQGVSAEFVQAVSRFESDAPHMIYVLKGEPSFLCREEWRDRLAGGIEAAEDIRSLAILPLRHEGQVVAALALGSHVETEIPSTVRPALEALAAEIGGTFARLRAEAAVLESRQNLQNLFDALEDMLFILDGQSRVVHLNPVVSRRLGYAPSELIGRKAIELHPPEWRTEAARIVRAMAAREETLCAIPVVTRNGEQIPVETHVTRGTWDDRQVLFAISRDITERLRSEQALRESEERHREVFEFSGDALLLYDNRGTILDANRAACEAYGYARDELLGMPVQELVDPDYRGALRRTMSRVEDMRPISIVARDVRKDGSTFDVEVRVSPIVRGGKRMLLASVRDVTERKQMEEALRRSESRYRTLVETIPYGIQRGDLAGTIRFANAGQHRMLGYPTGELIGTKIWKLVEGDDKELRDYLNRLAREQPPPELWSGRFLRKDGSLVDVEVDWAYERDDEGELVGFISVVTDVTDRKRAEAALEQRTRQLAKRLKELNCLYDISKLAEEPEVSLESFAQGVTELMPSGWEYPEITASRIVVHDQVFQTNRYRSSPWQLKTNVYAGGEFVGTVEVVYLEERSERDEGPFLEEERNLLNAIAERVGNVVDHMRAQRERELLLDQLHQAQKLEAVGTLSAGVAHDFNNILTVIVGHTDLATGSLAPSHPAIADLTTVQQAAHQAMGLTRSLLTFSQELPAQKETLELGRLLSDSARLLRRVLPAGIEVEVDVDAETPLWVDGDWTQLQQLVLNLVINARDAMPDGGQLSLRVSRMLVADLPEEGRIRTPTGWVARLAVSDTGMGILPEILPRIFEPFFTTRDRQKNTGLGLSIVHGVVKDHDGSIQVSSEVGEGTTMIVYLPCSSEAREGRRQERTGPGVEGTGQLLLWAGENPHVRGTGTLALESLGYRVLQAEDGPSILRTFFEHAVEANLVILDADLPKMSALECLREIRNAGERIPVILVGGGTAIEEEDADERTLSLRKPFTVAELAETVSEALALGA